MKVIEDELLQQVLSITRAGEGGKRWLCPKVENVGSQNDHKIFL